MSMTAYALFLILALAAVTYVVGEYVAAMTPAAS